MTDITLPTSLWSATASPRPAYAVPQLDMACDVAIVGGGFTGLSTALHLATRGQRVIVAEGAEPGWGASGRNGGQVIAGLKTDSDTLIDLFGVDLGHRMAVNMGTSADLVFDLVKKYAMDCHAVRGGWIQAAHGPKPYRDLVVPRCAQWRALGVAASLLDARETSLAIGSAPDAYVGAWRDPRGGVLQPLSYARGLAVAAMREGATVLANARVQNLREVHGGWQLTLDSAVIRARQVVLATNAYTGIYGDKLWPSLARSIIPVTSFQMATAPLVPLYNHILPQGQGVTDSRRLLLYFRRDHMGRLIMGGRSPVDDSPTKEDARSLQAAIRRIFPEIADCPVDFVWSGKVAITKDKLPHIHMLAPRLFAFMGCNGRGVAMCTMMGRLLADLASGFSPGDVPFPVTAPDTFLFHRLRKLGVFTVSQYYGLLDSIEAQQESRKSRR